MRIPFVDTISKVRDCLEQIQAAGAADGIRPVVISTMVSPELGGVLKEADALILDFFETFISPLEAEFNVKSSHAVGRSRKIATSSDYTARIDAVNYTLAHDDGLAGSDLDQADIILVGVSRSGKTPTSLYLALHFGVRTANYPLTPEDFERDRFPEHLGRHKSKMNGLNISPERLASERDPRLPDRPYSSIETSRREVDAALQLMRRYGIEWFDSTTRSIEEIAAAIMQRAKLDRMAY